MTQNPLYSSIQNYGVQGMIILFKIISKKNVFVVQFRTLLLREQKFSAAIFGLEYFFMRYSYFKGDYATCATFSLRDIPSARHIFA